MFENIEPLFEKEHLTVVNLESIIAGKEIGLSDFPRFNSPIEIGYKLKDMNVDILNLANNHMLDREEEGLLKSIENIEKIGLPYVGAFKSFEDQETLRIFHRNGLKICFLSYASNYGVGKRPKGKEYLASLYKDFQVAGIRRICNKIKRDKIADVIVLSMHFGKEYQMLPTASQNETVNSLSDAGADVIIGHHPHVLQPPAIITNSKGEQTFTAYSLGNFFSGQKGVYRQIGGYMHIDIEKEPNNRKSLITFDNPTFRLTFVDSTDKADYKMYLLKDYVENNKTIRTHVGDFDSKEIYEKMVSHMKTYMPDLNVY